MNKVSARAKKSRSRKPLQSSRYEWWKHEHRSDEFAKLTETERFYNLWRGPSDPQFILLSVQEAERWRRFAKAADELLNSENWK